MREKKSTVSPPNKRNLKQTIKSLLAMVLIAVIAVLGTLAYLGTNTDKEVNTFLGSAGIDLDLTEEDWTEEPDDGGPTEKERAKDYTPGGEYLKNPQLKNVSSETSTGNPKEWVAMKVSFQIGSKVEKETEKDGETITTIEVEPDEDKSNWGVFSEIADIQYTTDTASPITYTTGFNPKWILIATSTSTEDENNNLILSDGDSWAVYVYESPIAPAVSTDALFNKVVMKAQSVFESKPDGEDDEHTYIYKDEDGKTIYDLPAFNINVIGAAIKVEDTNNVDSAGSGSTDWANCKDKAQVQTELLGLLKDK